MRTFSTLFVVVLATLGCKKDPEPSRIDPSRTGAVPELADHARQAERRQVDLPPECAAYQSGSEKLARCEKLAPETKDVLKKSFEQSQAGWSNLTAEGKAALATSCQRGAEALAQVIAAGC